MRTARQTRETQIRPAKTAEWYTGAAYTYPAQAAGEWLPFVFLDTAESGGTITWSDRSEHPKRYAISPMGWLPPETRIDVVYDGRHHRIVRAPTILHGVSSAGLTAAAWNGSAEFDLGSGTVQIWRRTSAGVYEPQEYNDTDPVEMTWYNTSLAVAADTFLTAERNADNEWIVDVEPCDLAYGA